VSESNVDLAISSDATILAFHVATSPKARQNAERGGVEIRNYTVLYELLDDVRKMMEGTLSPEIYEEITGHVEIRRLFRSSKLGNIAGSHVIDGKVSRDSRIRLIRDGNVVWTGQIGSLRREKDEAKDVREGFDCGIVLKNYDDIREGDILEAFRMLERRRKI
jgi:translation initiation factor IF-2